MSTVSGQAVGMWVAQTVRDLYWCAVLKFMRDLYLTTPSDTGMLAILGSLEPMCQKELLLEDGTRESHFLLDPRGGAGQTGDLQEPL
jgi:hypothetical protein